MEDWPYLLAVGLVYIPFLVWLWHRHRRETDDKLHGVKPGAGFWNVDLLQIRAFRKASTIVSFLFLIITFVSASAVFGVAPTIVGFVGILTLNKLYDLFEGHRSRNWYDDWETGMLRDGWHQVSKNRWELEYWDNATNQLKTHVLFTDGPIPKRLASTSHRKIRRHPSYIVIRKRRPKSLSK
jgi:hypothetical protein